MEGPGQLEIRDKVVGIIGSREGYSSWLLSQREEGGKTIDGGVQHVAVTTTSMHIYDCGQL